MMATRQSIVLLDDDEDDDELQQLRKTPKKVASIWLAQSQHLPTPSAFRSSTKRKVHATTYPAKLHQPQACPSSQYMALPRDPSGRQVSSASDLACSTWSFPCRVSTSGSEIRGHSYGFTKQSGREGGELPKSGTHYSSSARISAMNAQRSVVDLTEEQSNANSGIYVKLTEPVCIVDDDSDIEDVIPSICGTLRTRRSSIQMISHGGQQHISDQVESFRRPFEGEGEENVENCEIRSRGNRTRAPIRSRPRIPNASEMVVDIDAEEEQMVIDLEAEEERMIIDLEEVEEQLLRDLQAECQDATELSGIRRRSTKYLPGNQPVGHQFVRCEKVVHNGKQLTKGKYVETFEGDFYLIADVFQNPGNGELALRGHRLQRSRYLNGLLPLKRNELCWLVEIEADDRRNLLEQSSININPATIKTLRRVNLTNSPFPDHTFRQDESRYLTKEEIERTAMLAVRWRLITTFASAKERFHNRPSENVIQRLLATDLEEMSLSGLAMSDKILRSNFRGHTVPGGSYKPFESPRIVNNVVRIEGNSHPVSEGCGNEKSLKRSRDQCSVIDLTEERTLEYQTEAVRRHMSVTSIAENEVQIVAIGQSESENTANPQISRSLGASISSQPPRYSAGGPRPVSRLKGQKYTYGDAFCGAGGATRGAVMAGLKAKWGFDFSEPACQTWHQNFPEALIYKMWAHQFIAKWRGCEAVIVDILHLSPPCQFFSPAHTVQGKDDEMNSASLFACGELLDVARPRVVTLEQTFGIYHAKFRGYFNGLINMFTSRGFSIRWKICAFQNWGLPQRRHRLVIIASCPGEVLPEFPPFTHAEQPSSIGVKKWNSVDDVLNGIPLEAPDHDIRATMQKPLAMSPWDSTSIAPRCITTHGGHNYHPSGVRGFTNREFAALQGFPLEHTFSERYVKKQIGNAVPPSIAKVLFTAVRKALEKADGIEENRIIID